MDFSPRYFCPKCNQLFICMPTPYCKEGTLMECPACKEIIRLKKAEVENLDLKKNDRSIKNGSI